MVGESATAPVTIRTAQDRQYLEANAWQVERIKAGLAAARAGRTRPADAVFIDIAAKHGWQG